MPRTPLVPRFQQRLPVVSTDVASDRAKEKQTQRSGSMAPILGARWRRRLSPISAVFIVFIFLVVFLIISSVTRRDPATGLPLSRGYEGVEPLPAEPVDETVVVIVPPFSRQVAWESLRTLLSSLDNAHYSRPVRLRIVLAPEANRHAFESRHAIATSAKWHHGELQVVNATSGGLYELSLSAWSPNQGASEHVVIVDATNARTVDSSWFEFLQAARIRYAGVADIAAYSPVRASVRARAPVTGLVKHWEPPLLGDNDPDNVFLYQSAAYAPMLAPANAAQWRAFQRWFAGRRSEWFLWPGVVQPRDRMDPEWRGYTARGRAHWTMWYARFLAEHSLYVLYPRAATPRAPPLTLRSQPIGELMRVSFDGSVAQAHSADDGGATKEELNEIVRSARRGSGSVAITIVNEAFLETAKSWICNVDQAGFRPPAVVWIATDQAAYDALRKVNGSHAIHMHSFKGGTEESGTHFNTPGYWLLMLERTRLIRDLLDRGVGVFAFETDQIWLRDPVPAVRRLVESGDGVDLVGTLDTRNQIGGNFLYFAPTLATRRLWREVAKRFSEAYHSAGMHKRHTAKFERYIENDQSILTRLVFYDPAFRERNPIVFRALDTDRFVDGRWYDGTQFYGASAQSPTMINNNFLVGIDPKIERARRFGHWFWDAANKRCDARAVRTAIARNDRLAGSAAAAAASRTGARARPEEDYDIGIDKAIVGIAKSLKLRY